MKNPDGSSSVTFSTLEALESVQGRREVHGWAVDTFLRQRADRLDVRRRARKAEDPRERARCRAAASQTDPPSLEECLRISRDIRRKREVDHPSTLLDG